MVSKYLDGLPLYRQSAILAREGIAIERATLADWVGHAAWWVTPLAELIGAHVMAAPIIHTDDTPIAVLAPGNGKTRTGRLWAYVVDKRPWQGGRAPPPITARRRRFYWFICCVALSGCRTTARSARWTGDLGGWWIGEDSARGRDRPPGLNLISSPGRPGSPARRTRQCPEFVGDLSPCIGGRPGCAL